MPLTLLMTDDILFLCYLYLQKHNSFLLSILSKNLEVRDEKYKESLNSTL